MLYTINVHASDLFFIQIENEDGSIKSTEKRYVK